jgi:hypothetical protein
MCAIAAALPRIYLDGIPPIASRSVLLPYETMEIDMRGRIDIAGGGKYAYIDLGEVKRQLEYADAVNQLGISLATIGWVVQVGCHVADQDMRLVGRLMVPKSSLKAYFVAPDQRKSAVSE